MAAGATLETASVPAVDVEKILALYPALAGLASERLRVLLRPEAIMAALQ